MLVYQHRVKQYTSLGYTSWSQHSWNTVLGMFSGTLFTPQLGNLKLHIFQLNGAHCVPQLKISPWGGVAQHIPPLILRCWTFLCDDVSHTNDINLTNLCYASHMP